MKISRRDVTFGGLGLLAGTSLSPIAQADTADVDQNAPLHCRDRGDLTENAWEETRPVQGGRKPLERLPEKEPEDREDST